MLRRGGAANVSTCRRSPEPVIFFAVSLLPHQPSIRLACRMFALPIWLSRRRTLICGRQRLSKMSNPRPACRRRRPVRNHRAPPITIHAWRHAISAAVQEGSEAVGCHRQIAICVTTSAIRRAPTPRPSLPTSFVTLRRFLQIRKVAAHARRHSRSRTFPVPPGIKDGSRDLRPCSEARPPRVTHLGSTAPTPPAEIAGCAAGALRPYRARIVVRIEQLQGGVDVHQ